MRRLSSASPHHFRCLFSTTTSSSNGFEGRSIGLTFARCCAPTHPLGSTTAESSATKRCSPARNCQRLNARLGQVLQEVLGEKGELLLWIPPSLPYYPPRWRFRRHSRVLKDAYLLRLAHGSRMLSTLISFEIERRTIGNPDSIDAQEKGPRKVLSRENGASAPSASVGFLSEKNGNW